MFKQGDKATFMDTDVMAEVQFGPVTSVSGQDAYLVKWRNGSHEGCSSIVWSVDLTPVAKFEVGQKVAFTYSASGESYELVAGPFPGDEGEPLWVLKDKDGVHDTSWEMHMVPVAQ